MIIQGVIHSLGFLQKKFGSFINYYLTHNTRKGSFKSFKLHDALKLPKHWNVELDQWRPLHIIIGLSLLARNSVKHEYNVILPFEYPSETLIAFGITGGSPHVSSENETFWHIPLLVFFEIISSHEYIFLKIWLWKKVCMKLLIIVIIILSVSVFIYSWRFTWTLNAWRVPNCSITVNGIIFRCPRVSRKTLVRSCVVVYYVICV